MAHKSGPAREGGKQPPFEIVFDDTCSIVCDDVPSNCTIRLMQVDGPSPPPRLSPPWKWKEDHSPASPSSGEDGWVPPQREKYSKGIGSPIPSSPPPPIRSRRSIVENLRRNIEENNGGASSSGIHRAGEAEKDVFALRKPHSKHQSRSPSPTPSITPAAFNTSSPSRDPSPPSSPQRAATDRLLPSIRPQMTFRRTNITLDGTDLHEMHERLGTSVAQIASRAVQSAVTESHSSSPPSSRPSAPSPTRGGDRCCGMADHNPFHSRSQTPERDSSGCVSPSGDVSAGAACSYHGSEPCPARAGARCRANREGQGSGSPPLLRALQEERSCKYHDGVPCPGLAGVPCRYYTSQSGGGGGGAVGTSADVARADHLRSFEAPVCHLRIAVRRSLGDMQKSGTSTSPSRPPSPSPRAPSSPHSPDSDTRPQHMLEYNCYPTGSPSGRVGVYYPPRTISPPPRNPRSRTPHRRAPHQSKGEDIISTNNKIPPIV